MSVYWITDTLRWFHINMATFFIQKQKVTSKKSFFFSRSNLKLTTYIEYMHESIDCMVDSRKKILCLVLFFEIKTKLTNRKITRENIIDSNQTILTMIDTSSIWYTIHHTSEEKNATLLLVFFYFVSTKSKNSVNKFPWALEKNCSKIESSIVNTSQYTLNMFSSFTNLKYNFYMLDIFYPVLYLCII